MLKLVEKKLLLEVLKQTVVQIFKFRVRLNVRVFILELSYSEDKIVIVTVIYLRKYKQI